MMDILHEWLGEGTNLSVLQMVTRAVVVFVIALGLIRFGRRAFGMGSAFDHVISILLGAVLSRAVVGASPFIPTLTAAFVIVMIHKLLAWLSMRYHRIGKLVKGEARPIFRNGKMIPENMRKFLITENDLKESLRHNCGSEDIDTIESAYIERDGRISIIRKKTTRSQQA